jgi:5-methylcytosine-specific restriction endonuclease McrA
MTEYLSAKDLVLTLRKACVCGGKTGRIQPTNGQNCVYCLLCGKFQYNAPRTETGEKRRSIQTTHELITPSKRARVLNRANGRCELCGNLRDLSVGHLLSVADGHAEGLTDAQINSDENLCAMCTECNLGQGQINASARFYMALLVRRNSNA